MREVTDQRRRDAIALTILALVPTLLFLDVLLGLNVFYARDVAHYYFPAKKVLRDIVLGGEFPFWNPWFSGGQPMAANPEHEVFYPLTWIILLPDYVYAFQLLPLVHVFIATFTMYALLRSMDLGRPAAVIGALCFSLGGLLSSMLNLFPYLLSIAWFPLVCLYTRRFLLQHRRRDFALAAFFLGLQLLVGEPTTAFQCGVLLGLYALYRAFHDDRTLAGAARRVAVVGAISLGALGIGAVQAIPTIDHFRDTARARGIPYEMASRWSLPFERLPELVYPALLGRHIAQDPSRYWGSGLYGEKVNIPFYYSIYSGLLLTVLAAAGLLVRARGTVLVLTIFGLSIVLAAGTHTPLFHILYDSGIASTTRYPEKFVLMLVFTLLVFGAQMLDRLLHADAHADANGDARIRRMALACTATVTVVAIGASLFSLSAAYEPWFRRFWLVSPLRPFDLLVTLSRVSWLLAVGRGILLLLLLWSATRVRRPLWLALAGAFLLLDVGALAPELAPRMPASFYREVPPVVRQFPPNRDDFRIFNVAYWSGESASAKTYRQPRPELYWILRNGLEAVTPASYGLRVAVGGDFDLTELAPTDDFTTAVWNLQRAAPGDWLNPVAAMSNIWYVGIYRKPEEAFARAAGNFEQIEPVRFIEGQHHPRYYFASEMAEAEDGDDFVRQLATGTYSRQAAFVRDGAFAPEHGVVRAVREWTNGARLDVETAGRAFLIMSVTPHKYWRITIDGRETPAVVTNIGYQGVPVPAGRHVVEMRYRNPVIVWGGVVSLVALLLLSVLGSPLSVPLVSGIRYRVSGPFRATAQTPDARHPSRATARTTDN